MGMKSRKLFLRKLTQKNKAGFLDWFTHPVELTEISEAYRESAHDLLAGKKTGSTWALPGIFLYRHALETRLKAILDFEAIDFDNSHDLCPLLVGVQLLCATKGLTISSHLVETVEELNQLDSSGTRYRYPPKKRPLRKNTRRGKRHPETSQPFELLPFIESIEEALDELIELQRELELLFKNEEKKR